MRKQKERRSSASNATARAGGGRREYTEFTGRKKKTGIKQINLSAGRFLGTGVGAAGAAMSYVEFEARFPVYD